MPEGDDGSIITISVIRAAIYINALMNMARAKNTPINSSTAVDIVQPFHITFVKKNR